MDTTLFDKAFENVAGQRDVIDVPFTKQDVVIGMEAIAHFLNTRTLTDAQREAAQALGFTIGVHALNGIAQAAVEAREPAEPVRES